ncbi:MAG: hypothetical protein MUP22_11635 [Desulfobacterales bacterium]|nr:hypothetical protein [Desulfobacterales bacterium]
MKLKGYVKYIFPIAILAMMVFAFQPMSVIAEEGTTGTEGETTEGEGTTVEDEGPALNNASQVLRAERISEASTGSQDDADAAQAAAQAALDGFGTDSDTALQAWEAALADEETTSGTYTEAELAAMEQLYNDVLAAEGALDTATANLAGTSVEAIEAMRAEGMGWGEICHFLGLHPSINGHGPFKNKFGETTEATVRNMKTGLANGHVNKVGGESNGLGLGRDKSKNGVGNKGASGNGNNGNGNGNGNAGGNGKSKGKGKGKSK